MESDNQPSLRSPQRGRAVEYLLCFAVREELQHLPKPAGGADSVPYVALVTGMGRRNASEGIREALGRIRPRTILTCGFAGGLNPKLPLGTVVFDEDAEVGFSEALIELGALRGKFYCSKRVAITAAEKFELWQSTRADAVEMESSVIRTIAREFRIPSATIRVISDTAHDDLPLDFNALMTGDDRINYGKVLLSLLKAPQRIPGLIEFQKQTVEASKRLGNVLSELMRMRRNIC